VYPDRSCENLDEPSAKKAFSKYFKIAFSFLTLRSNGLQSMQLEHLHLALKNGRGKEELEVENVFVWLGG